MKCAYGSFPLPWLKCKRDATHKPYFESYGRFFCDAHGLPPNQRAVLLLSTRQTAEGLRILAVTRRDNHNDWGLPGGKVEFTDLSDTDAIIRETLEETGYRIANPIPFFTKFGVSRSVTAFTCGTYDNNRTAFDSREGLCQWVEPARVLTGTYGAYNKALFNYIGWGIGE